MRSRTAPWLLVDISSLSDDAMMGAQILGVQQVGGAVLQVKPGETDVAHRMGGSGEARISALMASADGLCLGSEKQWSTRKGPFYYARVLRARKGNPTNAAADAAVMSS